LITSGESNTLVKGNTLLCSISLFAATQVFLATWLKKNLYLLLTLKEKLGDRRAGTLFFFYLYTLLSKYHLLIQYPATFFSAGILAWIPL